MRVSWRYIMMTRCTRTLTYLIRFDLQTRAKKAGKARSINLSQLPPSTCHLDTAGMRGMLVSPIAISHSCLYLLTPASPGRFFAAAELKTMLAHIVTTYDVKLEENTTRPRCLYIGSVIAPNSTAKVMFRKRSRQNDEH